MALPDWMAEVVGNWEGESKLHMSWLPAEERIKACRSGLEIRVDPARTHAEWHYTWTEDGNPQQGVMLIAGSSEGDAISVGWVDSWHQSADVMKLAGTSGQCIKVRGTYKVEGHPEWGWRIELEADVAREKVSLKMFNVSPEGEEEWAVAAEYARA